MECIFFCSHQIANDSQKQYSNPSIVESVTNLRRQEKKMAFIYVCVAVD